VATHRVNDDRKRRLSAVVLFMALIAVGCAAAMVFAPSCESLGVKTTGSSERMTTVKINGRAFNLELALDAATREKGLSGRNDIQAGGGMIFVFPNVEVGLKNFVMRDCAVPIDIIFLDGSGRVTAMHKMVPEEPRRGGESFVAYNQRLTLYSSKFSAQFAIELAGNTLDTLGVKEGQRIELDLEGLKKRAR
jgi:uncharacterized protein